MVLSSIKGNLNAVLFWRDRSGCSPAGALLTVSRANHAVESSIGMTGTEEEVRLVCTRFWNGYRWTVAAATLHVHIMCALTARITSVRTIAVRGIIITVIAADFG
jgi:hypothetical protein